MFLYITFQNYGVPMIISVNKCFFIEFWVTKRNPMIYTDMYSVTFCQKNFKQTQAILLFNFSFYVSWI